jgi:ATP-dependent Clp protease, protease subunit
MPTSKNNIKTPQKDLYSSTTRVSPRSSGLNSGPKSATICSTHNNNKGATMKKFAPRVEQVPETSVGIYLLYGDIDVDSMRDCSNWILSENISDNPPDVLNLVINSPGGSLNDAFALISIMNSSQIPIRTVGMGLVASAGLFIFMAGQKGLRTIDPNSEIMSHNFSSGSSGSYLELQNMSKQYKKIDARIVAHYKKHTGLSEPEIREHLITPLDVYLTAKEAVKLGLADTIGGL